MATIAKELPDAVMHGDSRLDHIVLRRLRIPLKKPYSTAYGTFHEFEPIVVEVHLADGAVGWGEGHIAPGSSRETREGGWTALLAWADAMAGHRCGDAQAAVLDQRTRSPVAATAFATAIEMAQRHPLLAGTRRTTIPLLVAVSASDPDGIEREIEQRIADGFTTFKVKVGPHVEPSLAKLRAIQAAVRGRARLRLDANRSFSREQGIAFATSLDPEGIELFEQPCHADAWNDNGAVAAASPVPLMLDESICSIEDIVRAGGMPGVDFCKLKLKRLGSLSGLRAALRAVVDNGMRPVLGDGLSCDLGCWMEACAGADLMHGAGEFNGFLKSTVPLMDPPLATHAAQLILEAGHAPVFGHERLAAYVTQTRTFPSSTTSHH
jgi:L-alanine-DL-glutamate epimerase-like enolase superfamily enzyme